MCYICLMCYICCCLVGCDIPSFSFSRVRVKQNKYPVSYLSHGEVTLWPAYADSRTHTTRAVLYTAIAYDLLGINVHTQVLFDRYWKAALSEFPWATTGSCLVVIVASLMCVLCNGREISSCFSQNVLTNEWLIQEAKDAGMVLIVWGDENNDPAVIRQVWIVNALHISCTRQSPWVETVSELKQERSHGESEGTNYAYGFSIWHAFAHTACHSFNSETVSTSGTLISRWNYFVKEKLERLP